MPGKKKKKYLIPVTLSVTLTHVDGGRKPSENCFLFQRRNKGFDSITATSQNIQTDHVFTCRQPVFIILLHHCTSWLYILPFDSIVLVFYCIIFLYFSCCTIKCLDYNKILLYLYDFSLFLFCSWLVGLSAGLRKDH